jgi:hypothetical protein
MDGSAGTAGRRSAAMNDPSIAFAMLGAGPRSRAERARESWAALVRRWLLARVHGTASRG